MSGSRVRRGPCGRDPLWPPGTDVGRTGAGPCSGDRVSRALGKASQSYLGIQKEAKSPGSAHGGPASLVRECFLEEGLQTGTGWPTRMTEHLSVLGTLLTARGHRGRYCSQPQRRGYALR